MQVTHLSIAIVLSSVIMGFCAVHSARLQYEADRCCCQPARADLVTPAVKQIQTEAMILADEIEQFIK